MDLIKKYSLFERDFKIAQEIFPKLSYRQNKEKKAWVILGEIDICDIESVYWNTFNIAIIVPDGYPYCVPILIEKSTIIPRADDWHISDEGICCLDAENVLIEMSRQGIHIKDFIINKIYNYLANQLYKLQEHKYAGDEYKHHTDGLIQYYLEHLNIPTVPMVVKFLKMILDQSDLTRNRKCPCNSGEKIKKCHEKTINIIRTLGRTKIEYDFRKITKHTQLNT